MIRLTGDHGYKYVAPEHIANIRLSDKKGYTRVYLSGFMEEYLLVTESPEEVARKVLEYKLAMGDYRQLVGEYKIITRNVLEELAGLEEQKDE